MPITSHQCPPFHQSLWDKCVQQRQDEHNRQVVPIGILPRSLGCDKKTYDKARAPFQRPSRENTTDTIWCRSAPAYRYGYNQYATKYNDVPADNGTWKRFDDTALDI